MIKNSSAIQKTWQSYRLEREKRNDQRFDMRVRRPARVSAGEEVEGHSMQLDRRQKKAWEPTAEGLLRGIWRLRVSAVEWRVRVKLKTVTLAEIRRNSVSAMFIAESVNLALNSLWSQSLCTTTYPDVSPSYHSIRLPVVKPHPAATSTVHYLVSKTERRTLTSNFLA